MKDVVVVGGGLAGLAAGWRLRHWDTVLLESGSRVGGRIRSERRGRFWLNWGGHVFAGPGSSTDALLYEVGNHRRAGARRAGRPLDERQVPAQGADADLPVPHPDVAVVPHRAHQGRHQGERAGPPVRAHRAAAPRRRPGRSASSGCTTSRTTAASATSWATSRATRQRCSTRRSPAPRRIRTRSRPAPGIGYFSLVWNIGQGLNRGIVGGPSTLTQGIATALGDRVQLDADVTEIVHTKRSVVVRYRQNGVDWRSRRAASSWPRRPR